MTEITTAGVTAVVIILTTLILVIATKLFSRSFSQDSNGGVVPNVIPDTSTSSPPTCRSCKYDVFISFRGEDTRNTFVGHLYAALQRHVIVAYKDDVNLERGDTIDAALLSAIYESHIALIIFSEKYADSSWCLDELSHIMKCKEDSGQIVIPIFYKVDPSDVRNQKGEFGKGFFKLSKIKKNRVESWKKALVGASNIAGLEPKQIANGHEETFIQEIVGDILEKLSSFHSTVDENLVGIESRLESLKSHLRIGSDDKRMVGIWGLGGAGKTTLATSLFKECSPNFDGCCFLGNIREASKQHDGLKSLQEKILLAVFGKQIPVQSDELGKDKIKQMLCRRKVLIVLDDVDHLEQLEALAGCREWFGDGSRIIITTRDEHLLKTHKVVEVYPISLLSPEEAARLFRRRAYHEENPVKDYDELSQQIVTYAAGLPLALIVLGSFLYDKDKDEWLSTLDRLKYIPETEIVKKLKISYDGLTDVEKELFLDIACFHRQEMREGKDKAMVILDACGFHSRIGIKVLIHKALITLSHDKWFDMHDMVQEMAYYIVRGEHPNNPEKHTRIWRKEDIEDICSRNATMENDKIEAIKSFVDDRSFNIIRLVSNSTKLRRLQVNSAKFDEGPSFLSNELRFIYWHCYPPSPFPESFQSSKLLVLELDHSLQKELWMGYKYLPCLKEMNLSYMNALVRIPDIGGLPSLQKLILMWSRSLEEIHQSLGNHSSLVHVSVSWCEKLTRFPTIVKMDKLKTLEISECEALAEFPEIEANLDSLEELSLHRVGIEILPSTVGEYCTNLTLLRLKDCSKLKSIDGSFHALKGLKNFELKGCKQFEKLPKDLFNENLDGLFFDGNSIKQLIPSSLPRLLRKLDLRWCNLEDEDIPNEIGELFNLRELNLETNDFTRLDFLSRLTRLKLLNLSDCNYLVELPELPSSLAILKANRCESLEVIKVDAHRRCKWLCDVSIWGGRKNITGGERLLESMLQGKAVKSGCMALRLKGLEIPKGFVPRVVRGSICRMPLPDNWYNHSSGFLFCVVHDAFNPWGKFPNITTTRMKHVKLTGDSMKMQDSQDYVVYWEETVNDKRKSSCMDKSDDDDDDDDDDNCEVTWVGYISFGSLRNTLWWNDHQTSTAIQIEFDSPRVIHGCGCKLIPKRSETTIITDSSSSFDEVFNSNDYTCGLKILPDSESTLVIQDVFLFDD